MVPVFQLTVPSASYPGVSVRRFFDLAVVGGEKNVEAGIHCPHIAAAAVGGRGAGVAGKVRGGVDDVFVVRQEVAAGGDALTGGDQMLVASVGVHDEDLVASVRRSRSLKYKALAAIGSPIRFGILAAVGELVDIGEAYRLRHGEGCPRESGKEGVAHRSDGCSIPDRVWS